MQAVMLAPAGIQGLVFPGRESELYSVCHPDPCTQWAALEAS